MGVHSFDLLSEIFDLVWPLVTLKATISENSRRELHFIWNLPTLIMIEIWISFVNFWSQVTFYDLQTTFICKAYGKRIILIKKLSVSNKIRKLIFFQNFRLRVIWAFFLKLQKKVQGQISKNVFKSFFLKL